MRHRNPKSVGELSEMEVFVALTRAGYTVLVAPFSDNQRYDCVLDDGSHLLRVQVKTGRISRRWPGVVNFSARSTNWHARTSASYHGAADLFAVWCPDNRKVYLVPVDECGRREVKLRLIPSGNSQSKGVRWAADYELATVAAGVGREGPELRTTTPPAPPPRPS